MWKTIFPMIVWSLLVVCVAGGATSQTLNRVVINNRSSDSIRVIAYDPICRMRVYKGLLIRESSRTIRVCANDRHFGSLIVYDMYGRNLSFSKIHDGSQVNIRFRRGADASVVNCNLGSCNRFRNHDPMRKQRR